MSVMVEEGEEILEEILEEESPAKGPLVSLVKERNKGTQVEGEDTWEEYQIEEEEKVD